MDGYELCRRIRALKGTSTMIVAITGWGHERIDGVPMRRVSICISPNLWMQMHWNPSSVQPRNKPARRKLLHFVSRRSPLCRSASSVRLNNRSWPQSCVVRRTTEPALDRRERLLRIATNLDRHANSDIAYF